MPTTTKKSFKESEELVIAAHLIIGSSIHFAIEDKIVAPFISNISTTLNSNKNIYNGLKENFINLYEASSARREVLPDAFLETVKICALILLKYNKDIKLTCPNWLPQGESLKNHLSLFKNFKIHFLSQIGINHES